MAVTLKDVAAAAGVSLSTASQVLRGIENSWISETTKKRVWEAAKSLGYRPNPAARLLASQRGHYFAIVLSRFNDLTVQEAVEAVVARVRGAGYIPFVVEVKNISQGVYDNIYENYDNIETLADGVIFIGARNKEFCERVSQLAAGVATVVVTFPLGSQFPEFVWDEEEGFERIMGHLDGLGHCSAALLGGTLDGNRYRLTLFQAACKRRGWDGPVIMCEDEKDPIQAGRQMAVKLLREYPGVTAVIGRNVEFSIGALAEIQRQGVRVPEDMSIVSYADCRIASNVWPGLTALRTPVQEAAERAVETALAMLNGQTVDCEPIVLPTEMVLRESTAPPRRSIGGSRRV